MVGCKFKKSVASLVTNAVATGRKRTYTSRTTMLKTPMKRLLFLALTTGTLLMGTGAYAQCCCCGQMNGQQGTTPPVGVKK